MKDEAHPEYHPVIFKDGEHEIVTRSTMTSNNTREVDGVTHYVIPLDISAFSHPFYTGKQKLVDSEGRVDRFMKRYNLETEDEKAAAGASEEAAEAPELVEGNEPSATDVEGADEEADQEAEEAEAADEETDDDEE